MDKPAETQFPLHDLLKRRWSPRAFSEQPVGPDMLLTFLEAARWAPSSSNEQPWRFVVATKQAPADYDRLLACLLEGNRKWAYRAPVLMLSVARMDFEEDGRVNRHAFHDVGLATENL
ncbi:MAG TPA: nitroreductase family protein, partial [Sphingobium sp.]